MSIRLTRSFHCFEAVMRARYAQTLVAALEQAASAKDVNVVILSGEGGDYSAGHDLDGFVSEPPRSLEAPVFAFVRTLSQFSKPIIASVEGLPVGIGTTMLLHCDLVYVRENARFRPLFVSLGLVPEAASSMLLPTACGHQKASELLLLGETFSATDAASCGFVNRILADGSVYRFAVAQAEKISRLPHSSIRETKPLLRRGAQALGREPVFEQMKHEVGEILGTA